MELWIRSQDKMKLFRCIDIRCIIEQEGCSIIDNTDDYIIATYKSIERALEVLDEIQEYIEKQGTSELITNGQGIIEEAKYYGKVYNMPKE